ncbi:MAG: extracellular solute-binding protein, partial [Tardiphaga sp.]|nr:extracellular solute-binding protein [Tardiphaga sp.]
MTISLSRRRLLQTSAFAALAPALGLGILPATPVAAQSESEWRHALSLFGEIKYPEGFKRFDYVNPEAPKGGVVRQIAIGTFDNF